MQARLKRLEERLARLGVAGAKSEDPCSALTDEELVRLLLEDVPKEEAEALLDERSPGRATLRQVVEVLCPDLLEPEEVADHDTPQTA